MVALASAFAVSAPLTSIAGEDAKDSGKNPIQLDSPLWQKPAWLYELSLGVHESYDSNVFLAGADQKSVPAGTTTLKNRASWVTTISPKLGFNFAPLLGKQDVFQVLAIGYTPDFVIFHNQPSETYDAHRVSTGIKGKSDAFSFSLDNAFSYIDGNTIAPTYPGMLLSACGSAAPRERCDQFQDRAKISFQYDLGNDWFIRPTASLLYYDLLTHLINKLGYQNYIDRYDVNGGADFGYRIDPTLAVTLGYRYGHQYQQPFPWDLAGTNSTNDYQRILVGIEGKPLKWLKLELLAGPDFRDYNAAAPVTDMNPTEAYAEFTGVAEITSLDTLALKYRRFEWVSCIGKVPYLDNLYDLSYRRQLTGKLQLELGARAAEADYNPAPLRDDWAYTLSAGFRYAITANLQADIFYTYDIGNNQEDGIPNAQTREYNRYLISFGTQWKF